MAEQSKSAPLRFASLRFARTRVAPLRFAHLMKQAVKESARSAEVRAELREQGYKIMWDVQQDLTG